MIEVLKEAREATGLTVREVAPKLKRSKNFVSVVETGERMLSVPEFIEYVRLLDADPLEVFKQVLALESALKSLPKKKTRRVKPK